MDHDHQDDHDIERWLNEGGVQLPVAVEMLAPGVLDGKRLPNTPLTVLLMQQVATDAAAAQRSGCFSASAAV